MEADALVDTGAITLCIPEHVRIQLDIEELERREVTIANGKKDVVPYVGPVRISCLGRNCYTGALTSATGLARPGSPSRTWIW